MRVLIFGYGNIDRQDDGVAWHVLMAVMNRMGIQTHDLEEDKLPVQSGDYEFQYQLQLLPELADDLDKYDKVVFIDAHTGNIPEDVHTEVVAPQYQSSPFTHHMTAATLLSLCDVIHHRIPSTLLVSVRGYEFQFTRSLSDRSRELIEVAVDMIFEWLTPGK